MNTENLNSELVSVGSSDLFLPLRVIDLDSPFFWGVGRDMTDEERSNAERHGCYDIPPMSVLGVTSEGLAAVEGKELAQVFAAAPEMLEMLEALVKAIDYPDASWVGTDAAREIIAKARGISGQNV